MEPEEPFQQGFLLFPPQGMIGHLKKTWHKRFCQLFKASKFGIERLEVYDNQEEAISQQHTQRIVTLENCIKIAPSNQMNVFMVVTKSTVYYFGCSSESEMACWINAFQTVAFKDNISVQTIEEDNDLYCTSGEGIFAIKVVETEASKRCSLEAKNYTLIVAATDIKLMDGDNILYTWPYRYIRRYGYREGKFTFEAGRKCETGEGIFCLEHSNQQGIFRCISSRMKYMKKLLNGETSPNIECNDAQFHAALSMEAGSRTPLPPSPNSSSNLIDLEFSSIAQNQQKLLNSSSSSSKLIPDSDNTPAFIRPPPLIIKPKPSKPPRKYMFSSLMEKKPLDLDFSDNAKYKKLSPMTDSPETSHRFEKEEEDDHYDLVSVQPVKSEEPRKEEDSTSAYLIVPLPIGSSKKNNSTKPPKETGTPTSPIIYTVFPDKSSANYDKLQHFGSTYKLNHSNSNYKTPNLSLPPSESQQFNSHSSTDSNWSNYDIVEDMSAVRLKDDGHHGYGVIRKKPAPAPDTGPKYKVYNDSEYAIVSKPKRV